MSDNDSLFTVIKGKFDDVMDAYRQVKHCTDLFTKAINETGPHHLVVGTHLVI